MAATALNTGKREFLVKIDGKPSQFNRHVLSISVFYVANKIPSARIILTDGDIPNQDFPISGSMDFVPGKSVEIQGGSVRDKVPIFKGIIVKQGIKARKNGRSVLIVEVKHPVFRMAAIKKSAFFQEKKDNTIFEEICEGYGIKIEAEDTSIQHENIVQYDTTDWQFLVSRAEINGKLILVEQDKLRIKAPSLEEQYDQKLIYGGNILDLDVEMDARTQYLGVNCRSWDYATQAITEAESEGPVWEEAGDLKLEDLAKVVGQGSFQWHHGGSLSSDELTAIADAQVLNSQLEKIKGRIRVSDLHLIKPGQVIELGGLGVRFNGKSFVSGVQYEFFEGTWTTDIQLGLNAGWFIQRNNHASHLPMFLDGAVSGLQIGEVTQLQGDPAGENRVKIKIPVMDPNEEGFWARIASLDAGKNEEPVSCLKSGMKW